MEKIRIAVVGAGKVGSSLYCYFRRKPGVEIAGIADVTGEGLWIENAVDSGVKISTSLEEILSIEGLKVIVETTKQPEIAQRVHALKRPEIQVLEASSLELITALGSKKEQTEAKLSSILGSVNDAIKIADKNGIITYVNRAFERTTGLSADEIIGKSVYEIFPDGPLVNSLKNKQQISGQKYSFNIGGREFNYCINPIIIRDEVIGVIGVFRVLPDVFKLMEELHRSTSIIEGLYDKLGQINGFHDFNMTDVMPIDKMEQILLRQALTKFGYSVEGKRKAAKALNISLATLYNKLKKYQIS